MLGRKIDFIFKKNTGNHMVHVNKVKELSIFCLFISCIKSRGPIRLQYVYP